MNDENDLIVFRNHFDPKFKHSLFTYTSAEMFFAKLRAMTRRKNLNIVLLDNILTLHDIGNKTGIELIPAVKNIDPQAAVVIAADSDNMEIKGTKSNVKSTDFIKKNSNFTESFFPLVYRLISEFEVVLQVRNTRLSIIVSVILLLLLATAMICGIIYY